MVEDNAIQEFVDAIKEPEQDTNRTYSAIVSRVDHEGTVWVHLVGSEKETPTASTSTEVQKGDAVTVEWRNNKLYIAGNYSNPAVGMARVVNVEMAAQVANQAAQNAVADAGRAREAAESVEGIARHAEEVAEGVEAIAESAKTAADTAFTNLSQVQSVLEVAQWIATHGTYVKATLFNPNATYYTITATQVTEPSDDDKDSQGVLIYYELDNGIYVRTTDTSVDEQKTYYRVTGTPVAQSSAEHIADYYTLAVSEAMADYVQSHLALTDEGLWIIKDGSGYKLKLTDYGSYIVAPDGTTVVNQNTADGNIIRALDGTVIAHLGYGEGQAQSGTAENPYYTLGTRKTTNIPYYSTATYSIGDLCVYNDKLYVCIVEITTPEQWNSSHWKLAIGNWSVIEGMGLVASGLAAHAEGRNNSATGYYAHAEGNDTTASGLAAHAEGNDTTASAGGAHAEGYGCTASSTNTHAEGTATTASADSAHAEGRNTTAGGLYSHAQNWETIASRTAQTVIGRANDNQPDTVFEIGNGSYSNGSWVRSNAFTVDWDGIVSARDKANRFSDIFDLLRPVWSTYQTLDANFNPNVSWGGTWERLPEGYIMLSGSDGSTAGDTYVVGADTSTTSGYKEYGENEHTLTADELPTHTHGNKSISGSFHARHYGTSGTGAQIVYTPQGIVSIATDSVEVGKINQGGTSGGRSEVVTINASHEHDSVGLDQPHSIMQKSIAVYTWIRTA